MAWRAVLLPDGARHVVPINDHRDHVEAPDCWCGPTDDEGVLVHHSMDRREQSEPWNIQ